MGQLDSSYAMQYGFAGLQIITDKKSGIDFDTLSQLSMNQTS